MTRASLSSVTAFSDCVCGLASAVSALPLLSCPTVAGDRDQVGRRGPDRQEIEPSHNVVCEEAGGSGRDPIPGPRVLSGS